MFFNIYTNILYLSISKLLFLNFTRGILWKNDFQIKFLFHSRQSFLKFIIYRNTIHRGIVQKSFEERLERNYRLSMEPISIAWQFEKIKKRPEKKKRRMFVSHEDLSGLPSLLSIPELGVRSTFKGGSLCNDTGSTGS